MPNTTDNYLWLFPWLKPLSAWDLWDLHPFQPETCGAFIPFTLGPVAPSQGETL